MFQRSDLTLIFFNDKKKSFVYIKIDFTRVNTVPRTVLQNLFFKHGCLTELYLLEICLVVNKICWCCPFLAWLYSCSLYPSRELKLSNCPFDSEGNVMEVCSRHFTSNSVFLPGDNMLTRGITSQWILRTKTVKDQ